MFQPIWTWRWQVRQLVQIHQRCWLQRYGGRPVNDVVSKAKHEVDTIGLRLSAKCRLDAFTGQFELGSAFVNSYYFKVFQCERILNVSLVGRQAAR
jgi:hypothetical protein